MKNVENITDILANKRTPSHDCLPTPQSLTDDCFLHSHGFYKFLSDIRAINVIRGRELAFPWPGVNDSSLSRSSPVY